VLLGLQSLMERLRSPLLVLGLSSSPFGLLLGLEVFLSRPLVPAVSGYEVSSLGLSPTFKGISRFLPLDEKQSFFSVPIEDGSPRLSSPSTHHRFRSLLFPRLPPSVCAAFRVY
jgi:hypothetical protein